MRYLRIRSAAAGAAAAVVVFCFAGAAGAASASITHTPSVPRGNLLNVAASSATSAWAASARGSVRQAAKAPYLFVYTEPGKLGATSYPGPTEINFTKLDGKTATLKTYEGDVIPPAYSGCQPPYSAGTCRFPGWDHWQPNAMQPTASAYAVMEIAMIDGTVEGDMVVGGTYVQYVEMPSDGGFVQTRAGNWWLYCLTYTPFSAPRHPEPYVFLRYSVSKGWEQIPADQVTTKCSEVPTG